MALYVTWSVQFLIDGEWGYMEDGRFHIGMQYESMSERFRKLDTATYSCGLRKALYAATQWGKPGMSLVHSHNPCGIKKPIKLICVSMSTMT